jgi:hypothetical protein
MTRYPRRFATLIALVAAAALAGCAGLRGQPAAAPAATEPAAAAPPPPPPAVAARAPAPARPVRTSCVPRSLAPPPRYPDTDAALRAAGGAADRYQILAAGRLLRMRRLAELERVVEACRRP